ncbi:MAG: cytochrome c family protein [Bacteroidetes bacterium]|nr:MAG: cytochrome c family protein [Bacteroidota bacterium]
MMRTKAIWALTFLLTLGFAQQAVAQLSPGDLTNAHSDLEGLSNCTQCHELGAKISEAKCLECHKPLKERIDRNKGFHVSREVKGKACTTCHSEHHGRKFEMIRFDEDSFDHNLTGYELTGEHAKVDCRKCHTPDFIDDRELRKNPNTFLGLSQECKACHEDVHQNTLSTNDCKKCHTTESFSPATKFDHDKTDFALRGKHIDVDCIDCHAKETRNGKEFQRFAGIDFKNCNSCHDDVHESNLGTNCKQCHNEQSFTSSSGLKNFNHNTTHFPLKGAHRRVSCKDCHDLANATPVSVFQDKLGIEVDDCVSCHEDVHDNKFGDRCVDCHNEKSFTSVETEGFNHNLTEFKLKGKHASVDCKKCHTTEKFTDPLPHETCADCHEDYHEGEFAGVNQSVGLNPDCAKCHIEEGFDIPVYTIEWHNESKFPLEGAHLATPCFACHLDEAEDKWHFRNIGERCIDCHEDVHEGYIAEEFYPNKTCEHCHVVDSWTKNVFDHNLTDFPLKGAHAEQACMDCHAVAEDSGLPKYSKFKEIASDCYTCHDDEHEGQFAQNGITDCARCHGFDSWDMSDFNHDTTAFKLEGKHAEVACEDCHKPIEVDGKTIIQYKFKSFECVVCHK